jgi:hypothetical protein
MLPAAAVSLLFQRCQYILLVHYCAIANNSLNVIANTLRINVLPKFAKQVHSSEWFYTMMHCQYLIDNRVLVQWNVVMSVPLIDPVITDRVTGYFASYKFTASNDGFSYKKFRSFPTPSYILHKSDRFWQLPIMLCISHKGESTIFSKNLENFHNLNFCLCSA